MLLGLLMICLCLGACAGNKQMTLDEGSCFSRFDYEYKVIQKLVQLEERQESMEKVIQTQRAELAAAAELQRVMKQTLDEQKEQLDGQKEQILAVDDRQRGFMKAIEAQKAQTVDQPSTRDVGPVAFSVYSLKNNLLNSKTPTFSKVAVNTGSFDMATGVFTAPVAGHYLFLFSMEHSSSSSGNAHCYIDKNNSGDVYARGRNAAYEAASVSVLYYLSVSDRISLRCGGWEYFCKGCYNTVFTGTLISQD